MPMAASTTLPLPVDALPKALRRFCDPSGPAAGRMMAAKGMVPVKGPDQVTLLAQLAADGDEKVAATARDSLKKLPRNVLLAASEAELPAPVLDALTDLWPNDREVLERIAANLQSPDATVERIARTAPEAVCERIATNEQRLLRAPGIIEALYKNANTRMSTADRLVELAARNGVELTGIPAFKDHVAAIQGQLLPEPTEEPLPGDLLFQESLAADSDDPEAIERDKVDGSEEIKEKFKPLATRVADLTLSEKIRLAMIGNAAARALLVRDRNKQVSRAAISSPQMSTKEAIEIAHSRSVDEDILRFIGHKREWVRSGEIKRALVFNPKTPVGISLRFIGHLRTNDLKALTRSRNVASQIKAAAVQHLARRQG